MKQITNSIKSLVRDFIIARHWGDVRKAKRVQAILKRKLGGSFAKTMLMHGDPDRDGVDVVLKRWEVSA